MAEAITISADNGESERTQLDQLFDQLVRIYVVLAN